MQNDNLDTIRLMNNEIENSEKLKAKIWTHLSSMIIRMVTKHFVTKNNNWKFPMVRTQHKKPQTQTAPNLVVR